MGIIKEMPVMNGFKTERIGTYLYVDISDKSFKDLNLNKKIVDEFYKKAIGNKKYNWITIRLKNNKGLSDPGTSDFFVFSNLNSENEMHKQIGFLKFDKNGKTYIEKM